MMAGILVREGLPGGGDADVVIAVVVPVVVDVQAVGIEVANVDTIAVRIHLLPVPVHVTGNRGLPLMTSLYPLFPEFYSGADLEDHLR